MIRPLRRRHLSMILLLAVLIPALIAAALAARRSMPLQPIPPELLGP